MVEGHSTLSKFGRWPWLYNGVHNLWMSIFFRRCQSQDREITQPQWRFPENACHTWAP